MTSFASTPGSAYEVAIGITAEEARDQGLVVVEYSHSTNPPTPIFGRYKDAPEGHALGITVADEGTTKVVGAGGPAFSITAPVAGNKGQLLNTNDPVIHGGTGDESVHADGAEPLADNSSEQEALVREGAHDPNKEPPAGKKLAK